MYRRKHNFIFKIFLIPLIFIGIFFFTSSKEIFATTFTVDSTTDAVDDNPGNGVCHTAGNFCTVRAAIQEANALSGNDTISIPAGTYTLSIAGRDENADATGDLDITSNITLTGASAATTILNANSIDRVLETRNSAVVSISNITFQGGLLGAASYPQGNGGGILIVNGNVTISNCIIRNNTNGTTDFNAGAGLSSEGGTLTISDTTFADNSTQANRASGGGLVTNSDQTTLTRVTFSNNTGYNAAAFYNFSPDFNATDIVVSGNTATGSFSDIIENGYTGIYTNMTVSGNTASGSNSHGTFFNSYQATLVNVTFDSNTINGFGGGIYSDANTSFGSFTRLTNITITNNSATSGGGVYAVTADNDNESWKNVLLSNNTGGNCGRDNMGVTNSVTSQGHNLSSDSTCAIYLIATGDQNSVDPLISPLADNGGFVKTVALQASSPAIDAGDDVGCSSTDARGESRPSGSHCDIGAYEYQVVVASSGGTSSSSSNSSGTIHPPSCDAFMPLQPELFQINTTAHDATLYFTPVTNNISYYYIMYGYTQGDQRFGVQFPISNNEGVQKYTIHDLDPQSTYFFQVRAGNGCRPGEFSNNLKAVTPRTLLQTLIYYLYTGK